MNADKLLKLIESNCVDEAIIQEFMDNIHPEKYITKANILKLIERDKNKKHTNLESIKDEDKIIAYLFIEMALCLDIADFGEKLSSLVIDSAKLYKDYYEKNYDSAECYKLCRRIYNIIGVKYSPLIFSIYDEINNFNNVLANFSTKYDTRIKTNKSNDEIYLFIHGPENKYSNNAISFTYKDTEDLVQNLPLLDEKLENWFDFRNRISKNIKKYEDLKNDSLFIKSENIHDTQYAIYTYLNKFDSLEFIEYRVKLIQKYHEKEVDIINVKEKIGFKSDEYISKLDNINIDELIDNIKVNAGKPYEYEITIENIPTSQMLFDSTSKAIKRITDKDGYEDEGNFYKLTEQINENIFLNVTDTYVVNDKKNTFGVVMSVFYFNEDFDINDYITKLKTLYYKKVESQFGRFDIADKEEFYAAFDNASISDLGQTRKELVKLL